MQLSVHIWHASTERAVLKLHVSFLHGCHKIHTDHIKYTTKWAGWNMREKYLDQRLPLISWKPNKKNSSKPPLEPKFYNFRCSRLFIQWCPSAVHGSSCNMASRLRTTHRLQVVLGSSVARLRWLAVLVEDEFEEEEMEYEDEETDGSPEEDREAAEVMAMLVERDDVLLVGRRWNKRWHILLKRFKVVLADWKVKTPCHANGVFINKC